MAHWGSPNKLVFFDDGIAHEAHMAGQKKCEDSPDPTQLTTTPGTRQAIAQASPEMTTLQSPRTTTIRISPIYRRQTFSTPEQSFTPSKRDFHTSQLPKIPTPTRILEAPATVTMAVGSGTALGARPKQPRGGMTSSFISTSPSKSALVDQSHHGSIAPASRRLDILDTTQCYAEPLLSSGQHRDKNLASGFEESM